MVLIIILTTSRQIRVLKSHGCRVSYDTVHEFRYFTTSVRNFSLNNLRTRPRERRRYRRVFSVYASIDTPSDRRDKTLRRFVENRASLAFFYYLKEGTIRYLVVLVFLHVTLVSFRLKTLCLSLPSSVV